jgi:SAM-dependent methyltransferase
MKNNKDLPSGFNTMSSEIQNAHNYNSWLISKIRPFIGKSVIEIGTGYGNFYKLIKPNCDNYYSVDIDQTAIDIAMHKNSNCTYFLGDIADIDFASSIKQYSFDTVICLNVLEHIKEDKTAIENMLKILKIKGYLVVFVPAFQKLYSLMDSFAGHHRRYTINVFKDLIKDLRMEHICLEYCNPIGGIGWYINKFIKHKDLDSKLINNQIKIFDNFIMPISTFLNPLTKRFFGQSLLFVGRRIV